MPRNGSGVYSLPSGYEAASGQTATATQHNTPLEDLKDDANAARPIVAGGTGATSASGARTALGLAVGSDVQAYDATLTSIAALGTAANKGLYTTGADTWAEFDLTAAGLALLDDADASAQRTTLGLGGAATKGFSDDETLADAAADEAVSERAAKAYADAIAAAVPIVEIARINLSNQATAEFDSADFDNSTYVSYEFEFINVVPATDGAVMRVQTSADGGTTYDSGASDYAYAMNQNYSSGTNSSTNSSNSTSMRLHDGGVGSDTGETGFCANLRLIGAGNVAETFLTGTVAFTTAAGNMIGGVINCRRNASEAVDAIKFFFDTGNLESGTIIMRGYRGA